MVKPMQLGHANIRVRDVERSEKFYTEVLGLEVNHRRGTTVFLSAREHSHELAIGAMGPDGFCRKVRFSGQNPKIGCQEFNRLQTPKLSKKQLCDRTIN